ncbi:MAG: sulfatase-like hydrolase/transferase [Cyclobacteriaceae bacterium]
MTNLKNDRSLVIKELVHDGNSIKLTALLLFLCFFACLVGKAHSQDRPNIIFVLTDDQSYGMMGCTGNEVVQTPHLDQLAQEGVLFTNAHITSAICTPSRASILLSEYERKHGINFNSGTSMDLDAWDDSYPMVLRKNGYYTGWVGKNHVPVGDGGYTSGVMEKSFDYWYAGHGHLRFYPKEVHDIFLGAEEDTQVEVVSEGVQDFLSNEQRLEGAVKFLEQRPQDKPFMLSVCFNLPHGAGTSTMQQRTNDDNIYKSLYRDKEIPMPKYYMAKQDITEPKLPKEIHRADDRQQGYDYVDTPETNKERMIRQYQAMTGIDRMIGQLRERLESEGLAKNTIIIFTSDHGLFMGQFGLGGKAFCYEQTTHVPLIVYNPYIRKKLRGRKSDALVQSIDIAPTMLEMAKVNIPKGYQGKSLMNLLNGEEQDIRQYLFTENLWSTQFGNPKCEAVQDKEWKYIRYYKNETLSAQRKIETAKMIGMPVNEMLYRVHDSDIANYRMLSESSLIDHVPAFEELYNLANDPEEGVNLALDPKFTSKLEELREVWYMQLINARGIGNPRVLRYTSDNGAVSK